MLWRGTSYYNEHDIDRRLVALVAEKLDMPSDDVARVIATWLTIEESEQQAKLDWERNGPDRW